MYSGAQPLFPSQAQQANRRCPGRWAAISLGDHRRRLTFPRHMCSLAESGLIAPARGGGGEGGGAGAAVCAGADGGDAAAPQQPPRPRSSARALPPSRGRSARAPPGAGEGLHAWPRTSSLQHPCLGLPDCPPAPRSAPRPASPCLSAGCPHGFISQRCARGCRRCEQGQQVRRQSMFFLCSAPFLDIYLLPLSKAFLLPLGGKLFTARLASRLGNDWKLSQHR